MRRYREHEDSSQIAMLIRKDVPQNYGGKNFHKENLQRMKQKQEACQQKIQEKVNQNQKGDQWKMRKFKSVEGRLPI